MEYQRFVEAEARAAKAKNDMFADDAVRFEPRPEDVLVALDGLTATPSKQGVRLSSHALGAEIQVNGLQAANATRMLNLMDGTHTAAEIGWQCPALPRLLRATFGMLVFAPTAVQNLETELSGAEITRYPSFPYGIARAYWANMVDVRRAIHERIRSVLDDPSHAIDLLCELHTMATMGADLNSFYKPSSPVSDAGVQPGALWEAPSRTVSTASGTLFLSGPRAKMTALAGERYHQLIYNQVGDPTASATERMFVDPDGLNWGQITLARAANDEAFAEWYCLPRPLQPKHFARMFAEVDQALVAAERNDQAATIEGAARFHWRYVHLHPFRCANQCIAMNIVNYLLKLVLPSGIPHLVLDSFGLRLQMEPYVKLFARAVASFAVAETNPAARYRLLRDKRQLAFAAMQRVNEAKREDIALEALRAHADEALAALIELS